MPNASTLANMAPGLVKVVERGTTSPIDGRAGWWQSPCPDLARGRGGKPPGLLYNGLILLANLLQSSSSTFSQESLPSFFAFKEGMLDTPISALGGWPTVSGR
jgi:hypothetical protein